MYSWALNEVKNKASKYTSTREGRERERETVHTVIWLRL